MSGKAAKKAEEARYAEDDEPETESPDEGEETEDPGVEEPTPEEDAPEPVPDTSDVLEEKTAVGKKKKEPSISAEEALDTCKQFEKWIQDIDPENQGNIKTAVRLMRQVTFHITSHLGG